MKVGIVGGGSIGLLVSSYLGSEHQVTIYVRRNEQKKKLNDFGLFSSETSNALRVKALLLDELKTEDCFLICVKQPQLSDVLPMIRTVNQTIPILFLQNGMGHIDRIKTMENPLFIGVVEHGALRESDNKINHTGKGNIKLAAYNEKHKTLNNLIQQLNHPNFPIHQTNDWKQLLTEKLAMNAVVNPLTTLFEIKNGDILNNVYIRKLAQGLCQEAAMVLDLNYLKQWRRLEEIVWRTGENTSSMLTDMQKNQQTEIDAISGYLIRLGRKDIPYTLFVYHSIKALEVKKGSVDWGNGSKYM